MASSDQPSSRPVMGIRPRVVLAAFVLGLVVFAFTRRAFCTPGVDIRTYAEMVRGVALHGLPYIDNGPAEELLVLRTPFNLPSKGHLWGIYGPAYAYYAALPYLAGGLRGATVATAALLVPIAITSFFLARRLIGSEWFALAAAILVVVSTPILGKSLEISAYPLLTLCAVAATTMAMEAIAAKGIRRHAFAFGVGIFAALGTASHVLYLPIGVALLGALALCDTTSDERRGPEWLEKTIARGLWPTMETLASAVSALVVMIVFTAPLAWLNKIRFGSFNPFSYGPVPWRDMHLLGAADQTISAHLRSAMPLLVLVALLLVGWTLFAFLPRGRRSARLAMFAVAAVVVLLTPRLREVADRYGQCVLSFIVDMSFVELTFYKRVPGSFANFQGPWVTKATLQCTPLLALALVPPRLDRKDKQRLVVLLAPCLALFIYLSLRGNLPLFSALGVPWVYLRYTLPALPMLLVGALFAARSAEFRAYHWGVAFVVGAAMATPLLRSFEDYPLYRQLLLLLVPLVSALVSVVALVLHRREKLPRGVAATAIAVTCGVGIGSGVGHDMGTHLSGLTWCQQRMDTIRGVVPARFGVFGTHPTIDTAVGVGFEREDFEYADIRQGSDDVDDWTHARPVIERWFAESRPVFYFAPDPIQMPPWSDVTFELVAPSERIFRVTPKESAKAGD